MFNDKTDTYPTTVQTPLWLNDQPDDARLRACLDAEHDLARSAASIVDRKPVRVDDTCILRIPWHQYEAMQTRVDQLDRAAPNWRLRQRELYDRAVDAQLMEDLVNDAVAELGGDQ